LLTVAPAFPLVAHAGGVAYNFVVADRDQRFLLPPDLRDWLPQDHLVWFVIDVVDQLDLSRFRASYRSDGHGRAAYDPAMMVGLLLYAYCLGVRSSRAIERRCVEDIAFRVLAGNHCPDHVTIARFRQRHELALAEVLVDSLRLCAAAGMVELGTVMLDGTKIEANATKNASRTLADIEAEVARMLADADAADSAEDERERRDRDGGVPPTLADPRSRLARLQEAKARLEADAAERAARFAERSRQLNEARAAKGLPARTFRPRPRGEAPQPDAKANVTDPDSRFLRRQGGTCQGYNAQIICTGEQVIVAAEITQAVNDVEQLEPMLNALATNTKDAGIRRRKPRTLVADAGYWRAENVDGSIAGAPELFIPVAKHARRGKPRKDGHETGSKTDHLVTAMNKRMATPRGKKMAVLRRITVEPTFGQIKDTRNARRFMRRGLDACASEWKLICGTHNLLKLWRHQQHALA
jgi:transposase